MKIMIVSEQFNLGGVERVSTEIANAFTEFSEVTLLSFTNTSHFYYETNNKVNKINYPHKMSFLWKIKKKMLNIASILTKKEQQIYQIYNKQYTFLVNKIKEIKPDIVILSQGILTSIVPKLKEVYQNCKYITWQHNEFEIYTKQYYKKFITSYINGLRHSDAVICLTKHDKLKYGEHNSNTFTIYNPLTITNFKDRYCDISSKIIIFVGRIVMEQKGLDYVIEIAKTLNKEWIIKVAGDGPDRIRFEKLIKRENLTDRIHLVGALSNEQLQDLYLTGSMFISTSRWEGFGLVITEAMIFGLPVVSFANAGPKEILNDGEFGFLIEKHNIRKFSEIVNVLAADLNLRRDYQKLSMMRAEDFNINQIRNEWKKVFRIISGS